MSCHVFVILHAGLKRVNRCCSWLSELADNPDDVG